MRYFLLLLAFAVTHAHAGMFDDEEARKQIAATQARLDGLAKTLDALGQEKFVDASGKEHSWREELTTELVSRQKEDGSFANANPRWMEGDPNLVTGYVLLTFAYLHPAK